MTLSKPIKIATALLITAAVIALWYVGAYLALRKSQLYIQAYISRPQSLEQFNAVFNKALDFYSPVGHDEVVSSYLGVILNLMMQESPPSREIADILIKQAEERTAPILEKKAGFLLSQDIFKLGMIYKISALKFQDETYYQKAVNTLTLGLQYSPNRPVFLYNLLDLYYRKGDVQKMKEIGTIILKYWPDDEQVKRVIESLGN